MHGYWQNRPSPAMKAAILADWMDELEDWHIDQIRWALREWRSINPSKKPNPGHIQVLLKAKRGQTWVAQRDGKDFLPAFAIDRPLMLGAAK